jgi:hypothetical protein
LTIFPTALASAETTPTPNLLYDQIVAPDPTAGAEAFGTAAVNAELPTYIYPAGVEGAGVGTPIVVPAMLYIQVPGGIASGAAFGSHTLTATVDVTAWAIAGAEAFGTAVLTGDGVITPTGLASDETIGDQAVIRDGMIFPTGLTSAAAFGAHTVALVDHSIIPTGVVSAETFGTVEVGLVLLMTGAISAEALGSPTLLDAGLVISPPGVLTEEAGGTPVVLTYQPIYVAGVHSGEGFGDHVVSWGKTLVISGIASAEALGAAVVGATVAILPSSVAGAEVFGAHTVTVGTPTLHPTGVAGAEYITTLHEVAVVPETLLPSGIASAEAVGSHTATVGTMTIHVTGVSSTEYISAVHVIGRTLIACWVTEDYTTYTESDPTGEITVTAPTITFTSLNTAAGGYVYYDYGAGYFDTSVEHDLEFSLNSSSDFFAQVTLWMLANGIDTPTGLGSDLLAVTAYKNTGASATVDLYLEYPPTYSATIAGLALNTTYYLTIVRGATTLTVYVYTDAARATLLTSDSISVPGAPTFRYVYGLSAYGPASAGNATGVVARLELGAHSIVSLAAVGSHQVNYIVAPSGLGSGEAIGTAVLAMQFQFITPTGIPSGASITAGHIIYGGSRYRGMYADPFVFELFVEGW